jgi:hypothetical protein
MLEFMVGVGKWHNAPVHNVSRGMITWSTILVHSSHWNAYSGHFLCVFAHVSTYQTISKIPTQ